MSHDELLATLEDIIAHVREGDSLEGSFEYLIPDPDEADSDQWMSGYMVRAAYRIGNLQGQGFMRMIGKDLP